jgi:hypothetical protein
MNQVSLVFTLGADEWAGAIMGLCFCVGYVAVIMGLQALMFWGIFKKAGKPAWASLVPIYNLLVAEEIVGRPMWWAVSFLCGPVGIILLSLDMAKCFGKEVGFAIGMMLLGIVFYPILGFGSAQYLGPIAGAAPPGSGLGGPGGGTPPPPSQEV